MSITTKGTAINPRIILMARYFSILLVALLVVGAEAFTSTAFLGSRIATSPSHRSNNNGVLTMKVVDVDSEAAFDKTISNAGGALVVIDYSTTWCGYVFREIMTV